MVPKPSPAADINDAALTSIRLVQALASDYRPRTLKQVCELCAANNIDATQTSVLRHLNTLVEADWLSTDDASRYILTPRFASIAVGYHLHLTARVEQLLADAKTVNIFAREAPLTIAEARSIAPTSRPPQSMPSIESTPSIQSISSTEDNASA